MRGELMAKRMRYLQTALKTLRNLISTEEFIRNQKLLLQIELIEDLLIKMERIYVFEKTK